MMMRQEDEKMSAIISKPAFDFEIVEHTGYSFPDIAASLSGVSPYYPNFKEWLFFTFSKSFRSGERRILMAHNGTDVCALSLLKATEDESKICTFFVLPEFRGRGLGRELMGRSLYSLKGGATIITVAEERHSELRPLLVESGFGVFEESLGAYRPDKIEFFYST